MLHDGLPESLQGAHALHDVLNDVMHEVILGAHCDVCDDHLVFPQDARVLHGVLYVTLHDDQHDAHQEVQHIHDSLHSAHHSRNVCHGSHQTHGRAHILDHSQHHDLFRDGNDLVQNHDKIHANQCDGVLNELV